MIGVEYCGFIIIYLERSKLMINQSSGQQIK